VPESFDGIDFALFSAGTTASQKLAPEAAKRGAIVIDNSAAWRSDPLCPLVVPEVNPAAAFERPKGIIANPNCSTIQMLVALKPLHDLAKIKTLVVSTYQATSGKGHAAVEDLIAQTKAIAHNEPVKPTIFPGQIAQNLLCDWKASADYEGYSEEEIKMVRETHKIMGDSSIAVAPTCVRVPVINGHSESVWIECEREITPKAAKEALRKVLGVIVDDRPYAPGVHPQPLASAGRDEVFVGRIRQDPTNPKALLLWVVADNLRKGAATNAVQIAELLASKK
jgi:aspartate-semialdehyde dehydrogenase